MDFHTVANASAAGSAAVAPATSGPGGRNGRATRRKVRRSSIEEPADRRFLRWLATVLAAGLMLLFVSTAYAAAPTLSVTPRMVHPGQIVHVSATGLAGLPIAGLTACLGILGPGQNVEQNLSPAFRPQIGTISVAADGSGQADPTIPLDLVPGNYRLILGGCSPHGNIAPLATIAQSTIAVTGSTLIPTPASGPFPGLPATGDVPTLVVQLVVAAGVIAVVMGLFLRRRSR